MILRRIAKGIKDQDWFVVTIEVMIVVVGIFIGLQVDDWNENRKAKVVTQSYYNRLIIDLQAEEKARELRITYLRSVIQHGEIVISHLANPEKDREPAFLHHLYQASQIWPYVPMRSTYDEMLSNNIAALIPDESLRTRLALYYVSVESQMNIQNERTPYRDAIRSNLPHELQSYIRENCGEDSQTVMVRGAQLPNSILIKACDMNLEDAVITASYNGLSAYPDLEKDLNRHLADAEQKIASMTGFMERTSRLIETLRGYQEQPQ